MSTEDDNPPAPNWLLKLEEQRAKRLKAKLGHEAGAGAPCQNCGDKCPGLDLHFWRKICKLCKCGKEDHDISDDDMYGFVQFQLLGSKPVKSKGILLKGRKDEVILDWTPKGSSNDVRKYLDELSTDMLPVKGSDAAKLRKQRLQKQMPAHDIDATLCHALTPEEIKELEEYVAHIRKHSVGQGKIIRLSLLKGQQHKIQYPNTQFLTQYAPTLLASSQTVSLQSSDLANNLHNLSLRDKTVANNRTAFLNSCVPEENIITDIQEQNPTKMGKIHDVVYSGNEEESLGQLPKSTEFPNYAPQTLHQVLDNQNPILVPPVKFTDISYPTNSLKPTNQTTKTSLPIIYPNAPKIPSSFDKNPVLTTMDTIHYPLTTSNVERHQEQYDDPNSEVNLQLNNANLEKVPNAQLNFAHNFINPIEQTQLPTLVGQPKELKYPVSTDKMSNYLPSNQSVPYSKHPNKKFPNQMHGIPSDNQMFNDQSDLQLSHASSGKDINPLINYNPNFINPIDQNVLPATIPKPVDLKYNNLQNTNISFPPKQFDKHMFSNTNFPDNLTLNNANTGYKYNSDNAESNPNFLSPSEDFQVPSNIKLPQDVNLRNQPFGNQDLASQDFGNLDPQSQNYINQDLKSQDFKHHPQIPILQAQNAINPLETQQNLVSVGYLRDINYPPNLLPPNLPSSDPYDIVNSNTSANIPACHECKKYFEDGSIAVSAERTDNLWHAACFNCHTCKQPLADLLYLYHKETDNVYCGRDYAILKGIPRCAACDELIFVREYCLAEGSTFHVKHFCCFECDEPLAGKQYVMENNQPVCVSCFENLKAEKCTDCGYVIRPDQRGVSLQNLHWHADPECFACKNCRKSLLGSKMLLKDNNLFCSDICYKSYP